MRAIPLILLLVLGLLGWAGCASQKPVPPPYFPSTNDPELAVAVQPEKALPAPGVPEPAPVAPLYGPTNSVAGPLTNSPTTLSNAVVLAPVPAWINLDQWSQTNSALVKLRRVVMGNLVTYELQSGAGLLRLTMGVPMAQWNGMEFWIGYPPRWIKGEPMVHTLDLEKNILPLIQPGRNPPRRHQVVVIDPGHGGDQVGTRCVLNNSYEKEYTLDWARRLSRLLLAEGWTVHLTRTNDYDVTLPDRVALADRVRADLFISLHFNSSAPRQDQSGLETYCLTPGGLPSSLTRGYEDNPALTFPNNTFDEENLLWGFRLHHSLLQSTRTPDRGVRRARFMGVLRGQNRPAVLIEGGYLSNPKEARLILNPDYRQKLAEAVARALKQEGPVVERKTSFLSPDPRLH